MISRYPCVLSIAGSDSSAGAGIQADIKTISAIGCYAATVITAVTAQNTMGVNAVYALPVDMVVAQFEAVTQDLNVQAIKIGMLCNQDIIEVMSKILQQRANWEIVLDPVMVSKTGHNLLSPDAIESLQEKLFPLCTLITPNIDEAEKLTYRKITNKNAMRLAAAMIARRYKTNVLLKGGHLDQGQADDVLYVYAKKKHYWYSSERIDSRNTHGTGCTLSAAIAAYMVQGNELRVAIDLAKKYLTQAIKAGKNLPVGHGAGPVEHFCV